MGVWLLLALLYFGSIYFPHYYTLAAFVSHIIILSQHLFPTSIDHELECLLTFFGVLAIGNGSCCQQVY